MAGRRAGRYSEPTAETTDTATGDAMLTAEGCRARRERLLNRLRPAGPLVLGDPIHLRYLANFHVDPFSLGGDFGGLLVLRPDGGTTLFHDDRLPATVKQAAADEIKVVPWYDGQSPGRGPRRLALHDALFLHGGRVHDALDDPLSVEIVTALTELRRAKDADELDALRHCMTATDAGHAWARASARAGMTELEVYTGIAKACSEAAGRAAIVYGDFAVSPGPARRGGPPTDHVLADGEMLILDFSVVLWGYRSDFTNTLVVGGKPTAEQRRLYDLCLAALAAGERELRAGAACLAVYRAVRGVFEKAGVADHFPHHAGHGLGLSHPEAPYFVRNADETLAVGDVVTLEPGLYVDGVGGIRIERNYHITASGAERLSGHEIALS
jgi:Xaa-Pro dipeptidase